jgi:hypothetical protein
MRQMTDVISAMEKLKERVTADQKLERVLKEIDAAVGDDPNEGRGRARLPYSSDPRFQKFKRTGNA